MSKIKLNSLLGAVIVIAIRCSVHFEVFISVLYS